MTAARVALLRAALESDDFEFIRSLMLRETGQRPPYKVVVEVFHKTRLVSLDVSKEKRLESLLWLAKRGCKYEDGRQIRADDGLPE